MIFERMILLRCTNPILLLGNNTHLTLRCHDTYFLKYLHRDVKEKVKILKNLANYELPTEELNEYIQASDGSDLLHCVFVNTKQ